MVYVVGKGDGNVRYYEILDEAPWICYLNQFISGAPQKSFGLLPKRGVDVTACEVLRFYKLHATKDVVEPISMIVPRKSSMFQEDIYPDTSAPVAALTGEKHNCHYSDTSCWILQRMRGWKEGMHCQC